MKQRIRFRVLGMTCVNCVRTVEKALQKDDRILFVSVNLATETGFVEVDPSISQEEIREIVQKVGYDLSFSEAKEGDLSGYRSMKRRMVFALIVTVPLSILMIFHMIGIHVPFFAWMEIFLGGFVIFYLGKKTIRGAWIALIHGHTNMDSLIFLGSTVSWGTGLMHLIGFPISSFSTIGAMIMALHILGRFIESYLRDRAAREIRALIDQQPKEARILVEKNRVQVPIEAVKRDMIMEILVGEKIPTDGIILSGSAGIDESMISGESAPVFRGAGDSVIGGSILLNRPIQVRVTKTGDETFMAQMIELIRQAQGTKVPIQALADRITFWFVPAIIFLAVVSGLIWYASYERLDSYILQIQQNVPWIPGDMDRLSFAVFSLVSTLVIACPCALGLATPMALIRGTMVAATKGLLIKNGEAIQTSRSIGYILLDKTGTLTQGRPEVVDCTVPKRWFAIIHAIESQSNHPLGKAITAYTNREMQSESGLKDGEPDRIYPLNNHMDEPFVIEEIPGQGIAAQDGVHMYEIGRPLPLEENPQRKTDDSEKSHQSQVQFRIDRNPIGDFWIYDPIREDTASAVAQMKEKGIIPVIVSGDRRQVVSGVAQQLGIEDYHGEVLPSQKLDIVQKYQTLGKKVMMVGDGLNDAAALRGADVGVAMGSGTDLAIESADIVILREGLSNIITTISISKTTFSTIRQNLFLAFLYNILAIPAAMMGLLHPAIAEIAMAISSISVVLNSLRIRP